MNKIKRLTVYTERYMKDKRNKKKTHKRIGRKEDTKKRRKQEEE